MTASAFSLVFAAAVTLAVMGRLWLSLRQVRHIARHRDTVPHAFRETVSLSSHQRAADYNIVKLRFGVLQLAVGTAVLLGWTLLGGLDALNTWLRGAVLEGWGPMAYQLSLLGLFAVIASALELPFDWWRQFRIEQRFGFNRMTLGLFLGDMLKGSVLGVVLGLPIAALILWLMGAAGPWWWAWAWGAWMGFNLLVLVLYPTVIAPLFNRFEPLRDDALKQRVEKLMQRCGFAAKGLFVMDGSRRSAHANAYFTGFGAAKRVVFFDTLLGKLEPGEVEAVLAHELGHFRHRHVLKRIVMMFAISLGGFALLGHLSTQSWFYQGLGVTPSMTAPNDAVALILFLLAGPVFTWLASPLMAALSRRQEFEADAYACSQSEAQDLRSALLKLYEDNAGTLTPDPVFVRFYYSHPPASERLERLQASA